MASRFSFSRSLSFIAVVASALLAGCAGNPPSDLGINADGSFRPCPDQPNCVVSNPVDEEHYTEAFKHNGDRQQARIKLLKAVLKDGGHIASERPFVNEGEDPLLYIHVEYSSRIMGFVDDVEFLINGQEILVRSASRLGYSDFGVNRERIDRLRELYNAPAEKKPAPAPEKVKQEEAPAEETTNAAEAEETETQSGQDAG